MSAIIAFLLLGQQPFLTQPEPFLAHARSVVGSGVESKVLEIFQKKEDAEYLFEMARDRGGLRSIGVSVIPAPPGWEDTAPYWAIFHARQDIESYHDPVYPILRTDRGMMLGKELPEWAGIETRISNMISDVRLYPLQNKAQIRNWTTLDGKKTTRAPIFRLNDFYLLTGGRIGSTDSQIVIADKTVPKPKEGDIVRAGSLLIPWTRQPGTQLYFAYEGTVNTSGEDKINERQVYLTAWWTPSIGRLPHVSTIQITGPKDFVLKGEGSEIKPNGDPIGLTEKLGSDVQTVAFRCNIPISYPKVIGGKYTLAAQATVGGRDFRSYQLGTAETQRGQREVQMIANAVQFYEKALGPFPFDHYYCFDAIGYYGIESYSHTLLAKGITLQFLPHEVGHTYFGGLVPSAYTRDSWNESLTQYIDSIVYQNNSDRTLEAGLRTLGLDVPLTNMPVAHANESAGYYRGAYVMRMLEDEIGRDKVLSGLRALINDRVGKATTWLDLLPYFEQASGQKLDWFWRQWISNSHFPTLRIVSVDPVQIERRWRTRVTVAQSGTADPFRLKFLIRVRRGPLVADKVVSMRAPGEVFAFDTDFQPMSAELDIFPRTLATVRKGR